MIDVDDFKLGMRRLAAGVSLITTVKDEVPFGLVATAVSSLSSDPPTLLACINRSSSCHEPISAAGVFCVNVLGSDDTGLATLFGRSDRRAERFADASAWRRLATGAPVLSAALVAFDCVVAEVVPYQTHTIFIGCIRAIHFGQDGEPEPLLYLDGAFRRLAERAEHR